MARILILYHSVWGHVEQLAYAAAQGVQDANCEAFVKRIPEAKADRKGAIVDPAELGFYDGFLIGTPSCFGIMTGQMRMFLDQAGACLASNALVGKPAGVFVSAAHVNGGQESAGLSVIITLLHFGCVVVGLPPMVRNQSAAEVASACSPYGACCPGGEFAPNPVAQELEMARFQGRHLAEIAKLLKRI